MTIYLDLDGVLADFEGTAIRILKDEFGGLYDWKQEIEESNWGIFGSNIQNIYERLDVMSDARALVEYVSRFGNVEILTAIPKRGYFPESVNHKRAWVDKNFPGLKTNFGPYAIDKQYHFKRGDVLIDDSSMNIEQWNDVGGLGILHINTDDTIEQLEFKRRAGLFQLRK